MSSILRALYDGSFAPSVHSPHPQPLIDQQNRYYDLCDAFQHTLKRSYPDLAAQFEAITAEYFSAASLEDEAMFLHGFCSGAKLMLEILQSPDAFLDG